jgi:hypothetical protein
MDKNKATGIPVFIGVYIVAVVVWVPCLLLSLGAQPNRCAPCGAWGVGIGFAAGGGAAFGFGWAIMAVLIGAIIGLRPTRAHKHAHTRAKPCGYMQCVDTGGSTSTRPSCAAPRGVPMHASTHRAGSLLACSSSASPDRYAGQSIAFTIGRYALRGFVAMQIDRYPRWKQARG